MNQKTLRHNQTSGFDGVVRTGPASRRRSAAGVGSQHGSGSEPAPPRISVHRDRPCTSGLDFGATE